MESLYFLSLLALLVQVIRKQIWRSLPCFTASIVAAALFEIAYQPHSPAWLTEWFAWLVIPLLLFRVLALGEALVEHSGGLHYRGTLIATAGLFAALFASVIVWRFAPGDAVLNLVQIRRVVTVGGAALIGSYMLLLHFQNQWIGGFFGRHVALLFVYWGTFAASSVLRLACPAGCWDLAAATFYAAHSIISLLWILQFESPRDSPFATPQPARSIFGSRV